MNDLRFLRFFRFFLFLFLNYLIFRACQLFSLSISLHHMSFFLWFWVWKYFLFFWFRFFWFHRFFSDVFSLLWRYYHTIFIILILLKKIILYFGFILIARTLWLNAVLVIFFSIHCFLFIVYDWLLFGGFFLFDLYKVNFR